MRHIPPDHDSDRAHAILKAQQELAPDGILVVDPSGRMVSFNSKFVSMWGVSRAVIEHRNSEKALAAVLHKLADPQGFLARVRHLYRHRHERSHDEILLKDGRVFERHSAPIFKGKKSYYGRVWYFRDISERKREQAELAASAEKYHGIFSKSAQPIKIIDAETGKVVDANEAAQRLYGYTLREFVNLHYTDLSAEPEKSLAAVNKVLANRRIKIHLRYHKKKNGAKFPVEITSGIFHASGRRMIIGMVTDISDRLRAQEAAVLRHKAAISRQFIANVSHELRTPTATILGYSETLLRGALKKPKEALEFTKIVHGHALHLRQLIEHLLDLAHLESGKISMRPERIDLRRCIEDLMKSQLAEIRKKGLQLRMDLRRTPSVWMDEVQLRRVLSNLLENACKYTPVGGRIELSLRQSSGRAVIAVADSGIGISKKDLPLIFNRFHRSGIAVAKGIKGTGLGLALVKEIVTSLGGFIWVKSAEGRGSTFYVAFPILKDS